MKAATVVLVIATITIAILVQYGSAEFFDSTCAMHPSKDCSSNEQLIFSDEFDYFDMQMWKHDVRLTAVWILNCVCDFFTLIFVV